MAAPVLASASLSLPPLPLPVTPPFGIWAALIAAGCMGLWSERTRVGKELSGALVSTLLGMLLANTGILPHEPPELGVVYKYVLPLAIPMLLFSANLRRILSETGRLLPAFLLGSASTAAGTLLAYLLLPLGRFLGEDGWRVASALTARHIGGAVNYMAVTDSLGVSPSIFGAGLAADDLILTIYFTTIYTLAKSIPPDPAPPTPTPPAHTTTASQSPPASSSSNSSAAPADSSSNSSSSGGSSSSSSSAGSSTSSTNTSASSGAAPDAAALQASTSGRQLEDSSGKRHQGAGQQGGGGQGGRHGGSARSIQVLEGLTALAVSACICHTSACVTKALAIPGQLITVITALTVLLATLFPRQLQPLVVSGQGLAQIMMQVFYATIGASANVGLVLRTAPVLFGFSLIALAAHLGLMLAAGRALGFSQRDLLLASNANIGGPSTVAGMAAAKGWTSSLVPGILVSTLGYALGTFVGVGLGHGVLRKIG